MSHVNNQLSWLLAMMMSSNKNEISPGLPMITIVVAILAILWYKSTLSSSTKGAPPLPPGPRSLPIVGYLPFLHHDMHKQFTNLSRTYGPIFKLSLGSRLYVVLSSPELAKVVVREQDDNFSNRNASVAISALTYGGQDIIWSDNNLQWRNLRKIFVQEVLSNKNLQICNSFRRNEVRKTIKNIFSKIGTNININKIVFLTVENFNTSMVWGNEFVLGGKDSEFVAELHMAVSKIFDLMEKPNVSDFIPSLAWLDLQGVLRDMKKECQVLDQYFTLLIDRRIKSDAERSKDVQHEENKDLLQILLELKDRKDATSISMTQVKAILLDIMIAAIDTTVTLIEWAMTEILNNQTVMKRVQEELTDIVGLNNMVEESHLPKLKYLDAVIKETFRVHSTAPLGLPRSPNKTCTVGGYTIPKGCTVLVNIYSIHRNPQYWDNPLEFNPERFLTHEGTNKWDYRGNNLKFLPFGSGRRLCPGIPLADKMQMYMLASLFHSFDWSMPNGEELDLSVKPGINLKKRTPLIAVPSQRLSDVSLYM